MMDMSINIYKQLLTVRSLHVPTLPWSSFQQQTFNTGEDRTEPTKWRIQEICIIYIWYKPQEWNNDAKGHVRYEVGITHKIRSLPSLHSIGVPTSWSRQMPMVRSSFWLWIELRTSRSSKTSGPYVGAKARIQPAIRVSISWLHYRCTMKKSHFIDAIYLHLDIYIYIYVWYIIYVWYNILLYNLYTSCKSNPLPPRPKAAKAHQGRLSQLSALKKHPKSSQFSPKQTSHGF